ncbi:hypothetical protein TNIN_226981 [Trichonephila inaurata madagascariensis]|uniref:Uncharacterized protein n=1 Tax=Trichonephila inaurata madagascariensis TaxID=2747483 RepID=A0A8X6WPD1_9ARAC|nr:hypothetical protein TNIN_226981 [Trichonephila inaurata madagascariensis]
MGNEPSHPIRLGSNSFRRTDDNTRKRQREKQEKKSRRKKRGIGFSQNRERGLTVPVVELVTLCQQKELSYHQRGVVLFISSWQALFQATIGLNPYASKELSVLNSSLMLSGRLWFLLVNKSVQGNISSDHPSRAWKLDEISNPTKATEYNLSKTKKAGKTNKRKREPNLREQKRWTTKKKWNFKARQTNLSHP